MNKTALAFMAHPDDAEFWCAGTLIRLADAGWAVHIASAAAGDCGTMTEDRWQISATRTKEASSLAALIGGTFHGLGEPDGLLVYDKPTLQKTIDLFRRVAPTSGTDAQALLRIGVKDTGRWEPLPGQPIQAGLKPSVPLTSSPKRAGPKLVHLVSEHTELAAVAWDTVESIPQPDTWVLRRLEHAQAHG